MPDEQPQQAQSQNTRGIKSRFLKREVIGIACLSVATLCAVAILIWACVSRGDCQHEGPDNCEQRKGPPVIGKHGNHTRGHHQRHHDTESDEHINLVSFRGNADFYGLGIRLGIYFQWVASLIANAVLDDKIRQTTTAPYVGFQIAVLAALLLLVFHKDCTFAAELIVIIYILLGGVFIVLAPEIVQSFRRVQWKDSNKPKYRLFSTFVWIIVGLVVPVSAWFWIRLASVDPNVGDFYRFRGTSMFFFGHIKGGGIRAAGVFMAIWSLVLGLFALEKIALAFLYRALEVELRPFLFILSDIFIYIVSTLFMLFKSAICHVVASYKEDSLRPLCEVIHDSLKLRKDVALGDIAHNTTTLCTKLYAFALAVISIIMSICSVELTLAWNHVIDINSIASTGQIIPLFVGIATLASVIWELMKKANEHPKAKEAPVMDRKDIGLCNHEACKGQLANNKSPC